MATALRVFPHARARRRPVRRSVEVEGPHAGEEYIHFFSPCSYQYEVMYMKKRVKNENLSVLIYLELAPDGFESNARASAHAAADGIEAGEGQHARVVESEWSWSCWTGKKITGTGTAHQRPYCT